MSDRPRTTVREDAVQPDPAAEAWWADDPGEAAALYRRLALHVIKLAFKDIAASTCPPGHRRSAREFLAGSRMFFHWCRVASLDPYRVMARAAALARSR